MPCAASPPMTFCHENVVTSSLSQGRSCAKAALVASQIVSPARSDGIAFPFGSRTPDVVPFHVKTTSVSKSTPARSTISPYSAVLTSASSLSCFTASVTQPAPKLSQAIIVQGRAPSIDHIAISTAPVSEAGTMPMRYSAGTPRIARVSSIAAFSLALPTAARCERPRAASDSLSSEKTGGLAQGPEEKRGLAGRADGLRTVSCDAGGVIAIYAILPDKRPSLGRGVPPPRLCAGHQRCKSENADDASHRATEPVSRSGSGPRQRLARATQTDVPGTHFPNEKTTDPLPLASGLLAAP